MDPTVLLLLGLDLGREGGWRLSRGLWSLVSGQNNLLNLYISGWWLNLTGIVAFRTLVLLFCHIGVDRLVYNVKMVSKKHFIPSGSPANGGSSPSSAKPPYHLPGANIGIIVLLFLPIPLSIYGVYYIHKHLRTSRCAAKNAAMNRARYAYGVEVPGAGEVRGRVVRMGDIPTATSRAAVMNIILRARRMPFISWCRKHHLQISQGLFFASTTSTSRFLPGSLLWICGKPYDDGIIIYHCVYEILSISEHPRFDYNRDYEYPLGTSTTNSSHTTGKAIAPTANASNTSDSSATLNEEEGPDQDLEEQLKRLREKHAYKETFHEQPTYESTFSRMSSGCPWRRASTIFGTLRDGRRFGRGLGGASSRPTVKNSKYDFTGHMFIKECWDWNFNHKFVHVSPGMA